MNHPKEQAAMVLGTFNVNTLAHAVLPPTPAIESDTANNAKKSVEQLFKANKYSQKNKFFNAHATEKRDHYRIQQPVSQYKRK